jgi:hypothetical protein
MALWNNPRWFDDKKRQEQLDDHIRATGKARFGIREFEETRRPMPYASTLTGWPPNTIS